jgi:hypothetical protein
MGDIVKIEPEQEGGKPLADQLAQHRGAMHLTKFAAFMGVSYDTALRWVKEEGFPAARIRTTYWVDPVLAAGWWRSRMVTPKPPVSVLRPLLRRVSRAR